jgi:hypothetical protein
MTENEIIETAIQGHASTRDAIRWAIQQERKRLTLAAECFRVCEHKEVCNEKATNNEANRAEVLGKS